MFVRVCSILDDADGSACVTVFFCDTLADRGRITSTKKKKLIEPERERSRKHDGVRDF